MFNVSKCPWSMHLFLILSSFEIEDNGIMRIKKPIKHEKWAGIFTISRIWYMNKSTNMHICVQTSIRNSHTWIWLRLKVNITNMKKGKDLKKTNYFKMVFVDPLSIKRAFYVIALCSVLSRSDLNMKSLYTQVCKVSDFVKRN